MAIVSKFLEDFSHASGIPIIGISRVAYTAAIAGYIYNVAIPEWKRRRAVTGKGDEKTEDEDQVQNLVGKLSTQEVETPKGPAVNK